MIVFKEFPLNGGISQHAYLIALKPSGAACECKFFRMVRTARDAHLCLGVHMLGGGCLFWGWFFLLHCLLFRLLQIEMHARMSMTDDSKYSPMTWRLISVITLLSTPPQSHPQFLTDTTLAACPEMSNLLPETRRWYSTMTVHLKNNICRNQGGFFTLGLISTISQAFIYHLDSMIATSIFDSLLLKKNLREKKTWPYQSDLIWMLAHFISNICDVF